MDIVLSFEPSDVKRLDRSDVAVTLVNDTAYAVSFVMLRREGRLGRMLCAGSVEAETELVLAVVPMGETDKWSEFTFQAVICGGEGEFEDVAPLNIDCRLDTSALRKESSYRSPVYSARPAHEVHLLREGRPVSFSAPDAERIRKAMYGSLEKALKEKIAADGGRRAAKGNRGRELSPYKVLPAIEVDLHIHELVDTTAGMDNTAMLMLQLDTVRRTMREHRERRGQEIIFIHGKGDGVLRKALLDLLRREFPTAGHRDASFRKYGFGATLVTIRK